MIKKIVFTILFSISTYAKEDIVFEGYYKLMASNSQIGYVILSYTYDSSKKQFFSKSLVRGNTQSGNLIESLIATADNQFKPISYQYTSKMNGTIKTIDAKFKPTTSGFKMTATMGDGQSKQTVQKDFDKKVFLSTFQVFKMLENGLDVGKKYTFEAISEEEATVHSGEALIKAQPGFEDKGILRVLNKFNETPYISNLTKTGEILITESPTQKIQTLLVATPEEATRGFPYEVSSIKLIFGDIPRGQKNVLAQKKAAEAATVKVGSKAETQKTDSK